MCTRPREPSRGCCRQQAGTAVSSAVRVIAEYSKNDKRRGKNHDIRLKDIRVKSPQMPYFTSKGYDAAHRSTAITVDGIYWNGREVSHEAAKGQRVGPFADPIRFVRLRR